MPTENNKLATQKPEISVRIAFLWVTIIALYIYADYFKLMTPDELKSMMELQTPLGSTTPNLLIGFSVLLIVPALMIPATILLPASVSKWLNIIVGLLYALISVLIIIADASSEWLRFYVLYQIVELFIFALIIIQAWNWPRKYGLSIE
mgnify:CR=1 FL=1